MTTRPLAFVTCLAALSFASCSRSSGVAIVDVRAARLDGNEVLVDVDVAAYEQSGREVGAFCISVHFLPSFYDTSQAQPTTVYFAEMDQVEQCEPGNNGLRDGDRKTYRLVSKRRDIGAGYVRAQSKVGTEFDTKDIGIPVKTP